MLALMMLKIMALANIAEVNDHMEKITETRKRRKMEIRSLEVDIDKGILKINGQDVDTPTIVTLPGPEGWPLQRLFASSTDAPVECNRIDVVLNNKP